MTTAQRDATTTPPAEHTEPPAIVATDVSKRFMLGSRSTSLKDRLTGFGDRKKTEFWAVRDVSVTVPRGSMLGVIGRNGSGKSTFLRTLCGIYRPTIGRVETRGRITALLELGAGFHPELTGRENVYMNGAVVGLGPDYMDDVMDEILDMAEIGAFIDSPIETYSSGMRARLGFAVTVQLKPEILLADEITAVGDITFKEHGAKRMALLRERGVTIVQVSHSLSMLQESCDQVLWLHQGAMMALGDPTDVITEYMAHAAAHTEARRSAEAIDAEAVRPGLITSVDIAPTDGGLGVTPGAGLNILIALAVPEPVLEPSISITLTRGNDMALGLGATFSNMGDTLTGTATARCNLSSLPLQNGRYRMIVDLLSGEDVVATRRVPLEVRKPIPAGDSNFQELDSTWDLHSTD